MHTGETLCSESTKTVLTIKDIWVEEPFCFKSESSPGMVYSMGGSEEDLSRADVATDVSSDHESIA
jgi:hypothetical protein